MGNSDLIPGSGRSPGEGNGNPLQYSCLQNSMDRGAWWAIVHVVTKESGMPKQLNKNKVGVSLHIVFLKVYIDFYFLISCIPDKIFAVISSLKFIELTFPYKHWRIDAFELWCWRILLRLPWTARRSNQFILNEISPEYSLEGLMLKLKFQYFGQLMWRADIWKDPDAARYWGQEERGRQRMRWLDGIADSMDESE